MTQIRERNITTHLICPSTVMFKSLDGVDWLGGPARGEVIHIVVSLAGFIFIYYNYGNKK